MTVHIHPGPAPIAGDAERLGMQEFVRIRTAALHARRTYPGPLGELVQRELIACAEFGHLLAADALIPRLVSEILAPA
ncbi:hypothetical protein ACVGOW_07330 [Pseudonocardia saturnea]